MSEAVDLTSPAYPEGDNPLTRDLVAGFALGHGVAMVKKGRAALAYYDARGELCCVVWRPLVPEFLGPLGRLLGVVLAMARGLLLSQPPLERRSLVLGALTGIGLYLGFSGRDNFWVCYALLVAPLVFSRRLWSGLAELRRFHGAEQQVIAAAMAGDLERAPAMPGLTPYLRDQPVRLRPAAVFHPGFLGLAAFAAGVRSAAPRGGRAAPSPAGPPPHRLGLSLPAPHRGPAGGASPRRRSPGDGGAGLAVGPSQKPRSPSPKKRIPPGPGSWGEGSFGN
ncbi:MAG: hypothetical protein HZB27_11195 [Meiothermus silvanus]|nr:hypothetical protein [Allomeiothermus silvanus]